MGLPEGHVTSPEIGLNRTAQLKAIGNGVCPPQAAYALRALVASVSLEVVPAPGRKMSSTPGLRALVLLEIQEPARYLKALDAISDENPWVWSQLIEHGAEHDLAIQGLLKLQELEPGRVEKAVASIQAAHPLVWEQLQGYLESALNRKDAA